MLSKFFHILGKIGYYVFEYPKIKHAELLEEQLEELNKSSLDYESTYVKREKRKLQLQIKRLRGL